MIRIFQSVMVLITIAILTTTTFAADNEPGFASGGIKDVYDMLPADIRKQYIELETEPSGAYFIDAGVTVEKMNVVFRINQHNELSHIGLNLFGAATMNTNNQVVHDYLERVLLICVLAENNADALNRMMVEDVTMLVNNKPVDQTIKIPLSSYFSFDPETPFNLKSERGRFHARWSTNPMNHFELIFPNNFMSISGMDKYELEHHLIREFQNLPKGRTLIIELPKSDLKPYDEPVFVFKGSIYKEVEEINSDFFLFYNEKAEPVFQEKYPHESASNLFLNLVPSDIRLQINHKLYGDEHQSYLVNINDFLSYFSFDHSLFFGWQNQEKNDLTASIFIYNDFFEYSHLLIVNFQEEDIFNDQRILHATFYTYTPQNNLKDK